MGVATPSGRPRLTSWQRPSWGIQWLLVGRRSLFRRLTCRGSGPSSTGTPVALRPTQEGTMQSSDIRIVIADDHQIVLEALELSLSKAGFNIVETAINPRLALEACLRHSANLFLTDLLMADENGLEAARKVRAKLPDCKVIVLTSSRSPWHLARAKHDGVDGYISKSAPIGSLVQAICKSRGRGADFRRRPCFRSDERTQPSSDSRRQGHSSACKQSTDGPGGQSAQADFGRLEQCGDRRPP